MIFIIYPTLNNSAKILILVNFINEVKIIIKYQSSIDLYVICVELLSTKN